MRTEQKLKCVKRNVIKQLQHFSEGDSIFDGIL